MHSDSTVPCSPPLTCTPPARPQLTSPTLRPGSRNGPKQPGGSVYSWVALKSLKRAIVVFYKPGDAERARQASDRFCFPPTASTPESPACFPWCAYSIGPRPTKRASARNVDSDDESAIFESPFHLRPPVTERNFLNSPPGSPPVGWEQTHEEPPEVPLAEDLQRALEQLRVNRRTGKGKPRALLAICPRMRMGSC